MTPDQFLQQIAPRLRLRLKGFRKVRRQVFRRIKQRTSDLGLSDLDAYWQYLNRHPQEWQVLAVLCRVTITRFYRDRGLWDFLTESVVPQVSRCWSAGCASGEEAYTVALSARLGHRGAPVEVVGTDIDEHLLARARAGRYPAGVLRELPREWRETAFTEGVLGSSFREGVSFYRSDLRAEVAPGPFDLVLCRNMVFTYFAPALQREVLQRMCSVMTPRSYLVLGCHERLPEGTPFEVVHSHHRVYRRSSSQEPSGESLK